MNSSAKTMTLTEADNALAALDAIRVDARAPAHVPRDRVVNLAFAMGGVSNDLVDPYAPSGWLNAPAIPRLLFNPAQPGLGGLPTDGSWVVTHYDDIDRVYSDNAFFSNRGAAQFQALIGETFDSIPLGIDPPDHSKYRMLLMPYFSPSRISRDLEPRIREIVVEMIEDIAGRGEVDIAWDFGRVFPVRVFMGLMGFPIKMFETFLDWERDILHTADVGMIQAALRNVLDFLTGFIAEKKATPDQHLVSTIVHSRIEGRELTEDEIIGMVWFLWLGGLDTVAATISQMFRRMALQPDIQDRIGADRTLINGAVEEFLRTQPILGS